MTGLSMVELKNKCLSNPEPGDVWHERFQICFLVIGVIPGLDFVIVSKAYNQGDSRFLHTEPCDFIAFTKAEFAKETNFCYPLQTRNSWTQLVKSINLPDNLLDDEFIKDIVDNKLAEIKLGSIVEVSHLRNPQSGDVWSGVNNKCIVILDKYLKDYLIISYVDTEEIFKIQNKEKQFTDIRVIHYEEFKFCVLNNQTVEEGFSAKLQQLLLKEEVKMFKQLN